MVQTHVEALVDCTPEVPPTHVSIDSRGCPFGQSSHPVIADMSVQLFLWYVQPTQPGAAVHDPQHCACPPVVVCAHPAIPADQPPAIAVPTARLVFLVAPEDGHWSCHRIARTNQHPIRMATE